MKSLSGDLHHVSKQYAWYHDPSSSGSPDILLTRLLYYIKWQSQKREFIQSNIYRILPKVNQIIYTLDPFCMPNIMTLAQAILQIVCSQGPLRIKWLSPKREIIQLNSESSSPDILFTRLLYYTKRQSWKREIIQSNIYRILPKVNQVIYTLDTFCMPNIMTLAQAVLQIFCSQGPLWVKCLNSKREIIQILTEF